MTHRHFLPLITTVAALFAATVAWAQVPLSLDPTFRTEIESANVFSAWPLSDGKVIVSGYLDFPGVGFTRYGARLNADGSRDLSFADAPPMSGKIISWQDRFYAQNDQTVRRFLMNGNADPAFQHMNLDPYFSSLQGGDYHVFPDGRVLMTGLHTIDAPQLGLEGAYNLVWFFNNGRLDTTRVHRTGNVVRRIKEIPLGTAGDLGGRFLLSTWGTTYEGQAVNKVFRIMPDGALDTTFHAPIEWGYVWTMEPLPDGRAYLGGTFRLAGGSDTIQVVRVMPDGSLDPTFNNDIYMVIGEQLAVDAGVFCIYSIAPGLLVLTGSFAQVQGEPSGNICMVDTSGNLVSAYLQGAGCGNFTYFGNVYGEIDGITRAPSGDYYIWGAYHGYTDGTVNDPLQRMVTRLHGGDIGLGVPEQQPTEQMLNIYPNPSTGSVTVALDSFPQDATLLLRDALGREVLRQRVGGYFNTLQVIGSGVYSIELWNAHSRIGSALLVVP